MSHKFKGWISQDGTNDPIIDLQSNTIGNIHFQYNDVGGILAMSDGLFVGRVTCKVTIQDGSNNVQTVINCVDSIPNNIGIGGIKAGVPSNNAFNKAYVEITCGL